MAKKREKSGGRTLLIDPCFGISGDMFLGGLIGLGAGTRNFFDALSGFGALGRYKIRSSPVEKCGIAARNFEVILPHHGRKHSAQGRTLGEIKAAIDSNGKLSGTVKKKSKALFERLAEAEAKVHGSKSDKVHFHEIGAVDSIIDICGACLALETLGVEEVVSRPANTGHGKIRTAHGTLPVPAPATAMLLEGVPFHCDRDLPPAELTTPTGALFLSELVDSWDDAPLLAEKTAFGAGSRDFKDFPNILKLSLCTHAAESAGSEAEIAAIESNLDDITGEEMANLTEQIMSAGALDFSVSGVTTKKGRPGFLLQVLAPKPALEKIAAAILAESPTLGVRYRFEKRIVLKRDVREVRTPYGNVLAKFASGKSGEILKVKPEDNSLRKLAKTSERGYFTTKKLVEAFLAEKFLKEK